MKTVKESLQNLWERHGVFFWLVNLFLVALILSYGASAWQEIKDIRKSTLTIPVQGEGKATVKPDVARLTATVLTNDESLAVAQEENTKKLNAVVAFLKSNGVEEKDIKNVGYNIYPQYSYPSPCPYGLPCATDPNAKPRITGYDVRATLAITVRDIGKAGEVLGGIVKTGVNEVSDLQFTVDDPEKAKAEARKKAIEDTRMKAKELAQSLGKRLGKMVEFAESGSGVPLPIYERFGKAAAFGVGGGGAPELPPGENEIVIQVTAVYEFK